MIPSSGIVKEGEKSPSSYSFPHQPPFCMSQLPPTPHHHPIVTAYPRTMFGFATGLPLRGRPTSPRLPVAERWGGMQSDPGNASPTSVSSEKMAFLSPPWFICLNICTWCATEGARSLNAPACQFLETDTWTCQGVRLQKLKRGTAQSRVQAESGVHVFVCPEVVGPHHVCVPGASGPHRGCNKWACVNLSGERSVAYQVPLASGDHNFFKNLNISILIPNFISYNWEKN